MSKFDLSDISGLQESFDRLAAKKQRLAAQRPLPAYVLAKIREGLNVEWTYNSNSIEGNTLTLRAVSYTHLDVYKRQVYEIWFPFQFHIYISALPGPVHAFRWVEVATQNPGSVSAVSYTHLDVYKRQG